MKIAVIGTGRVGLPLALAFAESGADVIGIDINSEIRQAVNVNKIMPFLEPGFEEILQSGTFQIREHIEDVDDVEYFIPPKKQGLYALGPRPKTSISSEKWEFSRFRFPWTLPTLKT